uniref:LRRCT domain-containing protein n=1 Tax=Branchiostoma floridae TaxID=7739 RepID=C3YMA6_BRAFL|eukprot:XP_002602688.1 hypothetical protein BRAFLDRAFT_210256 [Branchiostoma floridae]
MPKACVCNRLGLTSIPRNLPISLHKLDLEVNQIAIIRPGSLAILTHLETFDVAYNKITIIQTGTFAHLPRIQAIYMWNNQITMIQSGAFQNLPQLKYVKFLDLRSNNISVIPPSAFDLITYMFRTSMAGNPWNCDCKMIPFRKNIPFFKTFNLMTKRITCAQPTKLQGYDLKDINPEELICE